MLCMTMEDGAPHVHLNPPLNANLSSPFPFHHSWRAHSPPWRRTDSLARLWSSRGGSNLVRAPPRAQACLRQLPADHPRGPAMLKPPRTGVPMVRITEFLVQGCRRRLLHHPALLETSTHRRDPLGRLSADLTTVVCPGSNPAVEDHHLQRRSHRQRPQSKVCCRCARSLSLAHFCPCPAQMHAIPLSAEPHALEPFLFPPRRSAHAHTTPCCGDRRRPLPA